MSRKGPCAIQRRRDRKQQSSRGVADPIVVVEVLSPSTIDHDRGTKLPFYKELPSVAHIVLAYSDQMRVEHYSRTPDGWRLDLLTRPEESLALDTVEFAIEVRQVYFDLPF